MRTVGQELADLEYALHAARQTGNDTLIALAKEALRAEYAKYPTLKGCRVFIPFPIYSLSE